MKTYKREPRDGPTLPQASSQEQKTWLSSFLRCFRKTDRGGDDTAAVDAPRNTPKWYLYLVPCTRRKSNKSEETHQSKIYLQRGKIIDKICFNLKGDVTLVKQKLLNT
jgi:hypothetical protein